MSSQMLRTRKNILNPFFFKLILFYFRDTSFFISRFARDFQLSRVSLFTRAH